MPEIIDKQGSNLQPEVQHLTLGTTFCGILHPISSPGTLIHQFRGIKYASVPARFRQSRLFTSYPLITDATKYGPICPQMRNVRTLEETLFGLPEEEIPKQQSLKQNEFECLNMNITCPAGLTAHSRAPVMLWIHGGAESGYGSNWVYDGGSLVSKSLLMGKPIIVVTINLRIGVFGFAASPLIREDNRQAGDDGVGNYGLRDQRRAMEWLHRFIAEFGGDPNNITVFGESSGAADILCHLLSTGNQNRPFFHRAIIQSPVIEHNHPDLSRAGCYVSRIMASLHVSSIDQLRLVDADKIAKFGLPYRAVDNETFLRRGWQEYLIPEGAHHHHHYNSMKEQLHSLSLHKGTHTPSRLPANLQPLIIGDCASESFLWSLHASLWTPSAVVRRLKAVCQSLSKACKLLDAYDISSSTPNEEIVERVLELINDARVAWPTDCFAQAAKRERGGKGVWRYVFDQDSPWRGLPHHAADLIYLFDNVPLPACSRSSSACLQDFLDDDTESYDDYDSDETMFHSDSSETQDGWSTTVVDEWVYNRVRDAMQERWIAFAHGETPWDENKVFVFGPEGETGERSKTIFDGRRRTQMWKEAFEPLGMQLVQKIGVELSRGPPIH